MHGTLCHNIICADWIYKNRPNCDKLKSKVKPNINNTLTHCLEA